MVLVWRLGGNGGGWSKGAELFLLDLVKHVMRLEGQEVFAGVDWCVSGICHGGG